MKKISLLSLLIVLGALMASNVAFASDSVLSVSPSSANTTVGKTLSANVQVNPNGNKICVIKGTLNFDNLACQSITVGSGLMAQVTPTCSNPTFTFGIAGCSTAVQNLLTVAVKAGSAGTGNLTLTGIKLIGAGADVSYSLQNGSYAIAQVAVVQPKVSTVTVATPEVKTVTSSSEPTESTVAEETPVEEVTAPADIAVNEELLTASLANSSPTKTIIAIVIILMVIGGLWYMFRKKKSK